jgi:phosphatidate cytidylyltransferase
VLRWRLILGTIIIASLVVLFRFDSQAATPGSWLLPLALAVALLGAGEMVRLLSGGQGSPVAWVVYLGTFAVVFCSGVPILWQSQPDCPVGPLGWPLLGLAVAVLLAFLGEFKRYEVPGMAIAGLSRSVFAVVYVGLLLSFAVQLRLIGDGVTGLWAVVSLIAVVKMSDIGAYTVGRLLGRNKLAPKLSPGKTWEGLLGGVALACVTS